MQPDLEANFPGDKVRKMDLKTKTVSGVLLWILVLPALLWGYGKTVIRMAQSGVTATLKSRVEGGSGDKESEKSKPAASDKGKPKDEPVVGETGTERGKLKVSIPLSETDANSTPSISEPDLRSATYKQRYAKKPSIPSRFEGRDSANGYPLNNDKFGPLSTLGLIGIPVLVFGTLFCVMWGIISGRIRRIMV